jgi:hypothetical protein
MRTPDARFYVASLVLICSMPGFADDRHPHHGHDHAAVEFSIRSVQDGKWSDARTWKPARVPGAGDRVLIGRGTRVEYDVQTEEVVRLVQVVGTLSFARDRDTELNVGILTIQHSEVYTEHGFACEFEGASVGPDTPDELWPTLLIGTPENRKRCISASPTGVRRAPPASAREATPPRRGVARARGARPAKLSCDGRASDGHVPPGG